MSEGMSAESTSSWYDDAPITEQQIEEAREYIERAMLPAVSRFVARKLLAKVDRLHTWAGLMSLLDRHYPPDVFDGCSGDPGPRIIALTREVDRLRDLNAELSETLDVRHDETQQLRAKLATRGDLISGLDAEVDRPRAHLVAEHLATEAAETENDRLRARLDEIGETREEWAVRWLTAGGRYAYEPCDDESGSARGGSRRRPARGREAHRRRVARGAGCVRRHRPAPASNCGPPHYGRCGPSTRRCGGR